LLKSTIILRDVLGSILSSVDVLNLILGWALLLLRFDGASGRWTLARERVNNLLNSFIDRHW
jgi:hypothetical protein